MALSRSFKDTVKARADRDPEFRAALLGEAIEAFAAGDANYGKALRFETTSTRPSALISLAKLWRWIRKT